MCVPHPFARVCVCARACVCVCVCVRERERERETDRQTDRQRQREKRATTTMRHQPANWLSKPTRFLHGAYDNILKELKANTTVNRIDTRLT